MKNSIITFIILIIAGQANAQECLPDSFMPTPGEQYVLQAWVKDEVTTLPLNYQAKIQLQYTTTANGTQIITMPASGAIIDGWQRIDQSFTIPADITNLDIQLVSKPGGSSYFDDIRILPFHANMKSFVYDPVTQRLMAELDENNYATLYEYDREGGLVRVKKETERGIYTIQETRSGNATINGN